MKLIYDWVTANIYFLAVLFAYSSQSRINTGCASENGTIWFESLNCYKIYNFWNFLLKYLSSSLALCWDRSVKNLTGMNTDISSKSRKCFLKGVRPVARAELKNPWSKSELLFKLQFTHCPASCPCGIRTHELDTSRQMWWPLLKGIPVHIQLIWLFHLDAAAEAVRASGTLLPQFSCSKIRSFKNGTSKRSGCKNWPTKKT